MSAARSTTRGLAHPTSYHRCHPHRRSAASPGLRAGCPDTASSNFSRTTRACPPATTPAHTATLSSLVCRGPPKKPGEDAVARLVGLEGQATGDVPTYQMDVAKEELRGVRLGRSDRRNWSFAPLFGCTPSNMRFSSLIVSLTGGVSFAAAAPAPEVEAPRMLSEREVADLEARIFNATLGKRAFWAFIGWTGRDCTGGLAFAYQGQTTGGCTNTGTQAPSISYQNTWPVSPIGYSDTMCQNWASQTYVKDLGTNYWCMNGNMRSFQAKRVLDE
ncbi:hypothetical protein B0T16DRAFT_453217 [Cercophora newfieldiana]|uniref:Uncharacterized protein n=1 Tax=Cercophora newfieldiana TaxID=92897 RepID=A0AA40D007_9PEZI|nr:hypothetical protein B0T16DRAFT_453217 [Cercophora newfieldiana]